ncbi:MAG: hypothetical protein ACJ79A_20100, partial [Gemmatimonadaceae bacterium]
MSRRIGIWKVAAVVFTVVNLVGLGMAMAAQEQVHSGIHVALSLLGAFALWRLSDRSSRVGPASDALDDPRLEALQQSVDAIALEVERIGEAQRFNAK